MNDIEERKLESEIHQEFQLDRVILFSDAVFAIAITLMVIELRFPDLPKNATTAEFWLAAKPVIRNFMALVVSFIFIGMYWYRHLKLCGLLVDFNPTFITLNLLFLFFIVLFPFSVSSMMHISDDFSLFAGSIYFTNIFLTTLTHFILYLYLLGSGKSICRPISKNEKNILIENSLVPIMVILLIVMSFYISLTYFKDDRQSGLYLYVAAAVGAVIIRKAFKRRHKKMRAEAISPA